mgnify:CR=1 FL=1
MKTLFKFILNSIPRPILIRLSYVARPILAFFLKGKTFTDPIDGKSFKKFLSYGYETQRDNVLSPSTLSLERHRLLWLYLKSETNFFTAPLKVLHFAPEQSFYKRFRKMKNLDYEILKIFIPSNKANIEEVEHDLPRHWKGIKYYNVLQNIGSSWYKNKSKLILKVPSVLMSKEYNFVINTSHPDFKKVKILSIEPFVWDSRIKGLL